MATTKVIFWDVYGTLLEAKRGDLESLVRREKELRGAFEQTVARFSLPVSAATLHEAFLSGIATEREARGKRGIAHPEVRIEEVWLKLLAQFLSAPPRIELAREVAMFFERQANPKRLQPNACETLLTLQQRKLRQGIISNAQFYTPLELSELLREASHGTVESYLSIFTLRLIFPSCDLRVAKPDPTAFRRAIKVLARDKIAPAECLMVGDSQQNDIAPAREIGFRTVLYAPAGAPGPSVRADHVIQNLAQLPGCV